MEAWWPGDGDDPFSVPPSCVIILRWTSYCSITFNAILVLPFPKFVFLALTSALTSTHLFISTRGRRIPTWVSGGHHKLTVFSSRPCP